MPVKFENPWWKELSLELPGIYLLFGGRQTGKSTSMKLLIKKLIGEYPAENIIYLPCDLIRDHIELADEGIFRNNFCFITGSDQILLSNARRGFPGRRGSAFC